MSKRLSGNANLNVIKEAIQEGLKPFEGKKGTYLPITVWVNDEKDQFGNSASISLYNKETKKTYYLGNLKEWDGQPASGNEATPDIPF